MVDRLLPKNVWDKTFPKISLIRELIKELNEYLHILKPEKTPTIQRRVAEIFECLDFIQESLTADAIDRKGDAQVSVDAIRQRLTEISKFVSFCRAITAEPSDVILSVLALREGIKTEVPTLTHMRARMCALVSPFLYCALNLIGSSACPRAEMTAVAFLPCLHVSTAFETGRPTMIVGQKSITPTNGRERI